MSTSHRAKPDWVIRILVVFLLVGGLVLAIEEHQSTQLLPRGTPAPDVAWEQHSGGTLHLHDTRKHWTLLNFWATWCPPCVHEMPMLLKVAEDYAPRGLKFVAASADENPREAVTPYLQRKLPGLAPYVVYPSHEDLRAFQITSFPTFYLLNPEGNVAGSAVGAMPEKELRAWLDSAFSTDSP